MLPKIEGFWIRSENVFEDLGFYKGKADLYQLCPVLKRGIEIACIVIFVSVENYATVQSA